MGFDGAVLVWLDWKILKMKGCPDVVVVIVLAAVLIMVVCGLPNKLPNGVPPVDDAITLFPTLLTVVPEANKPVKLFTLVAVKKIGLYI